MAKEHGFISLAEKQESMSICFLEKGDYRAFIASQPGQTLVSHPAGSWMNTEITLENILESLITPWDKREESRPRDNSHNMFHAYPRPRTKSSWEIRQAYTERPLLSGKFI